LASLTAAAAAGFLYVNFDPTPAGADVAHKKTTSLRVAALPAVATRPASAAPTLGGVPAAVAVERQTVARSEADRTAMLLNVILLEQGRRRLKDSTDYTCSFYKQERIGSDLSDGQSIELKMRHRPFSVYMKWVEGDKGRELLYVDGEHDNKIIVHPGGWKARLIPAIKLEPEGSLAMSESRHPVTMVGLLRLTEEIITRHKSQLDANHPLHCRLIEEQVVNDRLCYGFVITYLDRKISTEYRKGIQFIDKELLLPVTLKKFGWPEEKQTFADENALDDATILEHYAYTDIQFNQQLANEDFSRANEAYNFRR
jgi:hypothetical protein